MDDTLEFTAQLAKETGHLLKSYFSGEELQADGLQARLKKDRTVVTEADLAADEKIRAAIRAAYPTDNLLTEESDTLVKDTDAPVWVVDPLDGTTNFSLGLPIWGVSIARLVNGRPQIGVLYFPVVDELYTAQQGKGAFLNGKPLKVTPSGEHPPYTFFACCSRTVRNYDVSLRYKTRVLGAAAYDFCAVARGAAIIAFQATPKIWDLAAGWLILQEAGGKVEVHSGQSPFPLQPEVEYKQINFPTIMAVDQESAHKAMQQIKKKR